MKNLLTDPVSPAGKVEQDASWQKFVKEIQHGKRIPFDKQLQVYNKIYSQRRIEDGPARVWVPGAREKKSSNIACFMNALGFDTYSDFHEWSVNNRAEFWSRVAETLEYNFAIEPEQAIDLRGGPQNPVWFPGARLNCADNCFNAPASNVAIIAGKENSSALFRITYGELDKLTNRIANGLVNHGFVKGDCIALYMPMTVRCIAAYLGIIRAGCQVVSIADSFSASEIRKRMKISKATAVITVDGYVRSGKIIRLYEKVKEANAGRAILIESGDLASEEKPEIRAGDIIWNSFLSDIESFNPEISPADFYTNILFSSGTTGTPKAIPWNQLTPLKCAADGYFHQDIHAGDVVAWPTNIGWMMGPWLIYAALINKATIALYEGAPSGHGFIRFVKNARVNMLGLIPSLVKSWRKSNLIKQGEWKNIRLFSSTGEPSTFEDYFWLMSRTDFKAPVIEYMGGTEIGGGYLTGSIVQAASPSTFTTPALGIDFVVLNDKNKQVADGEKGQVFLIPPSIGLSQELLNKDHFEVYYKNCPADAEGNLLRRHGDQIRILYGGFFQAEGRTDDTMNLGGIKVSSVELEKVISSHENILECAAISVPGRGEAMEHLVVFAKTNQGLNKEQLMIDLRKMISAQLNPLFKIYDLIITGSLPKTASNKLIRKELRKQYIETKIRQEQEP